MKNIRSKSFKTLVAVLMIIAIIGMTACSSKEPASAPGTGGQVVDVKPVTLKLAHFLGPQHFLNVNVVEPFAKEIEELTEGRVKIDIYTAGSLGPATSLYDMASDGIADISISLQSYTSGKFPLSSVVELPFMSSSAVVGTEIFGKLYDKFPEIQDEYKSTKVLWFFQNDAEYIMSAKKPIRSLDDLEGMKIRVGTDSTSYAIESWGGSPMFMPMNDVYDSAQRGVIDGATGPLAVLEAFRLSDVMNYYTGGPFTIANLFVVMNNDTWNNLAPQDQEIFDSLSEKYSLLSATQYDEAGLRATQAAIDKGAELIQLSDVEQAKFESFKDDIYQNWLDTVNAKGLPGDDILNEAIRLSNEYKQK